MCTNLEEMVGRAVNALRFLLAADGDSMTARYEPFGLPGEAGFASGVGPAMRAMSGGHARKPGVS